MFDNPVRLAGGAASAAALGRSASTSRSFSITREPRPRSRCICFTWCASCSTAAGWCAGWTSSGGCWPIPAFEDFAKDGPKTWRKLNGVMCLATQSASDVLESPISRTLIEQTPTKVFFPNADASRRGIHARDSASPSASSGSSRSSSSPARACFLVKQAHHSVVCQLDLKGFDAELAVISGRAGQACADATI